MQVVLVPKDATHCEAQVQCWLGDKFSTFKRACDTSGVRPVKDASGKWHNVLTYDSVPALSSALRTAGFNVTVDPNVATLLAQRAVEVRTDVDAADQRAALVDADLKTRGLALFTFQRYGVGWLAPRKKALLADQMGLGKTIQVLVSLPAGSRVVWIAPKATLTNVRTEVQRFRPTHQVTIIKRGQFRWPAENEIIVTNYEATPDDAGAAPAGVTLVADEAHMLKTGKAKRTARFRAMAAAVSAAGGNVWLVTGTPQLNMDPMEMWNVLEAAKLANDAFGSFAHYKRLWNAEQGRYGIEWGNPSPEVATLLQRVMLARRRTEVLPDLPTKMHSQHLVDTSDIPADALAKCDAALAAAVARGVDFAALKEEPTFSEYSAARAALATAKVPALLELVETYEAENEPLVVFSAHRAPVDALATRDGWRVITGDTTTDDRGAIVAAFQAGQLRGVALTIAAGGIGITMTRSHNVLFVDRAWTPALNEQAEDRCCRIGQDRGVNVITMVVDHPVDSHVAALVMAKQRLLQQTVEAAAVVAPPASEQFAQALDAAAQLAVQQPAPALPPAPAPRQPRTGTRRGPKDAVEQHASQALNILVGNDPDMAQQENGIGFNGTDTTFGHSLQQQLADGLSDRQWQLACKIVRKYHRQVGHAPQA